MKFKNATIWTLLLVFSLFSCSKEENKNIKGDKDNNIHPFIIYQLDKAKDKYQEEIQNITKFIISQGDKVNVKFLKEELNNLKMNILFGGYTEIDPKLFCSYVDESICIIHQFEQYQDLSYRSLPLLFDEEKGRLNNCNRVYNPVASDLLKKYIDFFDRKDYYDYLIREQEQRNDFFVPIDITHLIKLYAKNIPLVIKRRALKDIIIINSEKTINYVIDNYDLNKEDTFCQSKRYNYKFTVSLKPIDPADMIMELYNIKTINHKSKMCSLKYLLYRGPEIHGKQVGKMEQIDLSALPHHIKKDFIRLLINNLVYYLTTEVLNKFKKVCPVECYDLMEVKMDYRIRPKKEDREKMNYDYFKNIDLVNLFRNYLRTGRYSYLCRINKTYSSKNYLYILNVYMICLQHLIECQYTGESLTESKPGYTHTGS